MNLERLYSILASYDSGEFPREISRTALIIAIDAGWKICARAEDQRCMEVLERNEFLCGRVREQSRILDHSMAMADYFRGKNRIKLANAWHHLGDLDQALEYVQSAEQDLSSAVEANPQNNIWRSELVHLLVQSTNLRLEKNQLAPAAIRMKDAIQNAVAMLKNDPQNSTLRISIIKMFVKLAEISERRRLLNAAIQEYYIAAQDCRLLFKNKETRAWAFRVRLWLLSQVVARLHESSPEFQDSFPKIEENWIKGLKNRYPDCDASLVQPILDGKTKPTRPDDLEI